MWTITWGGKKSSLRLSAISCVRVHTSFKNGGSFFLLSLQIWMCQAWVIQTQMSLLKDRQLTKCQTLFPAMAIWRCLGYFGLPPKAPQEMLWIEIKQPNGSKRTFNLCTFERYTMLYCNVVSNITLRQNQSPLYWPSICTHAIWLSFSLLSMYQQRNRAIRTRTTNAKQIKIMNGKE